MFVQRQGATNVFSARSPPRLLVTSSPHPSRGSTPRWAVSCCVLARTRHRDRDVHDSFITKAGLKMYRDDEIIISKRGGGEK